MTVLWIIVKLCRVLSVTLVRYGQVGAKITAPVYVPARLNLSAICSQDVSTVNLEEIRGNEASS